MAPAVTTSSARTLFDKVWDAHTVRELSNGQSQLFIGLHLIHEVTSPQAFAMLHDMGLPVRFPGRTFATVDHIIPTDSQLRPLSDPLAASVTDYLARAIAVSPGPREGAAGLLLVSPDVTCGRSRRPRTPST